MWHENDMKLKFHVCDKVLLDHSHPNSFNMAAFAKQQSLVVATESTWSSEPEIFTS